MLSIPPNEERVAFETYGIRVMMRTIRQHRDIVRVRSRWYGSLGSSTVSLVLNTQTVESNTPIQTYVTGVTKDYKIKLIRFGP